MITLIKNFLSKGEACELIRLVEGNNKCPIFGQGDDALTSKIIPLVKDNFNAKVRTEFKVLRRTPEKGHCWHCDGGKPEGVSEEERNARYLEPWKNVKWVANASHKRAYTSIILLSNPETFEGGELCTYDDVNDKISRHKKEMYLSLVMFESNHVNQHMVTPIKSGHRIAHIAWYELI